MMDSIVASIVRQRAIASRIRSASNLRQISLAILLYTEDSKGPYPPDLGTLVQTEDISPRVFLNPATGNTLPDNWEKMTKDEQFNWVSDDSDYVFAGAGLSQGADPAIVIAYEKQGETTADGVNVLYADGHVEFDTPAQLKSSLEQSKKLRSQSK
jgi:prepilin-type processing-associated H-X9-DG protein